MTAPLPPLRYLFVWAWSNCGILLGIARTKREAIREIEKHCGEPWTIAKRYMEVRKVQAMIEEYK